MPRVDSWPCRKHSMTGSVETGSVAVGSDGRLSPCACCMSVAPTHPSRLDGSVRAASFLPR